MLLREILIPHRVSMWDREKIININAVTTDPTVTTDLGDINTKNSKKQLFPGWLIHSINKTGGKHHLREKTDNCKETIPAPDYRAIPSRFLSDWRNAKSCP